MSEGIAYQNKDIEFKVLSESFKEKSFAAYGLNLPRIKDVLPTNLPAVSANELRMDNLFLLEDHTYALVDYESENTVEDRIKYVDYIARIVKRFYKENAAIPGIRMVVIYTGDVEQAEDTFHMGCMVLHMEQAFIRSLPAEDIYRSITYKMENSENLTEQELMQLIVLPLAEKGKIGKRERLKQIIDLAQRIGDEQEQKFVFAGLLVASDKFIDKADAEIIRREITMTKVGRLIFEDGMAEGEKKGEKKERMIAIMNMLELNIEERKILELYSKADLRAAKEARAIKH